MIKVAQLVRDLVVGLHSAGRNDNFSTFTCSCKTGILGVDNVPTHATIETEELMIRLRIVLQVQYIICVRYLLKFIFGQVILIVLCVL